MPPAEAFRDGAGSGKSHGADSIRPRSRHILVRKLTSGVLPAGALNGGTIMTFLKTREPAEIDTSAETEVEGEIREFVRRDVVGIRRQPESDSDLDRKSTRLNSSHLGISYAA